MRIRHQRRSGLAGIGPLLLALAWMVVAGPSPVFAADRPNILWIIGEDMGPDLGCYGTKQVFTPAIDGLASQGVRYTRAFTTTPVCSTSRSSFHTGMYATSIGAHHHRSHRDDGYKLPPGVRLITHRLKDAGYTTANIRTIPGSDVKGTGKTDWNFTVEGEAFDTDDWALLKDHQPFFAEINFSEAHRGGAWPAARKNNKQLADPKLVDLPPYYADHPVIRDDWANYLDAITALDAKVGVVLEQLAKDGLADNTIVVFMSDHGRAMIRGKQFLYDEGIRIPLMIRFPKGVTTPHGTTPGQTDDRLVSAIDLTATTLNWAGIDPPATMQGRVLLGPDAGAPRRAVFATRDRCDETVDRIRCVRTARYKYIRNSFPDRPYTQLNRYKERQYPPLHVMRELYAQGRLTPQQAAFMAPTRPAEELYDLDADPHELNNLAASPEHQHVLVELRAQLDDWIRTTGDQGQQDEDPATLAKWQKQHSEEPVAPQAVIAQVREQPSQTRPVSPAIPAATPTNNEYTIRWPEGVERAWVGVGLWANRLQDWRVADGRLECVENRPGKPMRTVHLLTHRLKAGDGDLSMTVRTGVIGTVDSAASDSAAGFLIGAGTADLDYRAAALVHHASGRGGGIFAGVDGLGRAVIRDNADPSKGAIGVGGEPAWTISREGWKIVHADSVEPGNPPEHILDGDPATIWHTQWMQDKPPHPHEVTIDMGKSHRIGGFAYLPRQEQSAGRIARFAFHVSSDGQNWTGPVATGGFPDSPALKQVMCNPVEARYVRLIALSAHNDRPSTTMAEFYVVAAAQDAPDPAAANQSAGGPVADATLALTAAPLPDGRYELKLTVAGKRTVRMAFEAHRLSGNLALVSHPGSAAGAKEPARYWFDDWRLAGSKLDIHPARGIGPILCTQYTLSDRVMKLTAQLMPLGEADHRDVELQIKRGEQWHTIATTQVIAPGWTAPFRIENWDASADVPYRVAYRLRDDGQTYAWSGVIRREPTDKRQITVAAFTGNHNTRGGIDTKWFDFSPQSMWFPHNDITAAVAFHNPDVLFFSGDQVYEGASPTAPERQPLDTAMLDYMYKWYLWCWAFRDLARDRPTICIPDDHDVYHGNLWGAGGKKADGSGQPGQDSGGYTMDAQFVRMVERTQTSHLPDPFDPTPVQQSIGVYYTHMDYGGVSLAILEDRKFKSSATPLLPEANVVNGWARNPAFDMRTQGDHSDAALLGERQEKFLAQWAADWTGGVWMKAALSQTIFANVATLPPDGDNDAVLPRTPLVGQFEIPRWKLAADTDSNGWPQSGRNRALRELRKGFAFHIAGDQHLGSVVHYGVETWDDAGYAFCVPSIANFFPRRWYPPQPGRNRLTGMPDYTGQFLDGFGNYITVYAVSNPVLTEQEPTALHSRAPGYGIVRFNRENRTITAECWPRYADPSKPDARQYLGWPVTIRQQDNYGRNAATYLPTLEVTGMTDPVVQLIDEADGQIVYTLRIRGTTFRPKVFKVGVYTLRIGEPGTNTMKTLTGIASINPDEKAAIQVAFE